LQGKKTLQLCLWGLVGILSSLQIIGYNSKVFYFNRLVDNPFIRSPSGRCNAISFLSISTNLQFCSIGV